MEELMHVFAIQDVEGAEQLNNPHRRQNPYEELNESQFIKLFRVSKDLFNYICDYLKPYIASRRLATVLDMRIKVLTALKFFASGSYQPDVGCNIYIDISQSAVSTSIKEVVAALTHPDIFNEWVKFPNNLNELNKIRGRFFAQFGFPGTVGCIDCTHVAIFPPNIEHPEQPEYLYINRKGYHSINVQVICDSSLKIINVNARYPGSTNDAYIWNQSNVHGLMQQLHQVGHTDYFLLGYLGYSLRSWLLTPFNNVKPNTPESRYNNLHKTTRATIERCNGVLKGRFRCLLKHPVLYYTPEYSCRIINACIVLHNMCIAYHIPEPEIDEDEIELGMTNFNMLGNDIDIEDNVAMIVNPDLADGRRARRRIVRQITERNIN